MTLATLVADLRAGRLEVGFGDELPDGTLVDGVRQMDPDAPVDDVTAEAFNQDVFDPEQTTWDEARAAVAESLGRRN